MTKAEEVHQRIDALVAQGATKAEAFRTLSEEYGQTPKSLQGAYYQHARKGNGGTGKRSSRTRETTPADALESAKAVFVRALEAIDDEIVTAKERIDEAKAEHEALKASADERKQAIQAKLDALEA